MINSRGKGGEGEREFCRWLHTELNLDFMPTRNLDQVRDGGADIICVKPFVFEVKRCQTLAKRDWWLQVKAASKPGGTPVVVYRQNNQQWRFLISASCIGLHTGFVQLEEYEAIKWLLARKV